VDPNAEPSAEPEGQRRAWLRPEFAWVSSTYFAEGYPYAIVNNLADIMFKQLGASLELVGLTSLFHLPWNLKFLWGPFVDEYGTKRAWLIGTQVVLSVVIAILALVASLSQATLVPLAICFLVLAILSATHDIAIDGFYLEALDEAGQSTYVGFRAAAYKVAVVAVSGPLIWLCARAGWAIGLLVAAGLMVVLVFVHAWLLPKTEVAKRSWAALARLVAKRGVPLGAVATVVIAAERQWSLGAGLGRGWQRLCEAAPLVAEIGTGGWIAIALLVALLVLLAWVPRLRARARARAESGSEDPALSDYARNFVRFLDQPKIGVMLAFVLLFRTGESFLLKMRWPFLSDSLGVGLDYYAEVNGLYGVVASIAATILGGRLIARDGLRRWIWPFVLGQNLLNLLYMGLALTPAPGSLAVATVITLEHVGSGLGTAVFMVYTMRTCDPAHKAGNFAIVSALMSLSFTLAGVFSGFLASSLGFANYFGFTFLATIPSMVLIPFVPYLDGRRAPE